MGRLQWYAYFHVNGRLQVKRYFSQTDIDEARESDFVKEVYGPYLAEDRATALKLAAEYFSRQS